MSQGKDGRREGYGIVDLLFLVAALGAVGAVPVAGVVRARIAANESTAIGDVRTVISAQSAYQAANGGWYEKNFSCLAAPGGCIPSAPTTTPTFLDSQLAALTPRAGYGHTTPEFGLGPRTAEPTVSPGSVSAYVYVATPMVQGQTGVRGFGGDASGIVCYSQTGASAPTNGSGVLKSDPVLCITLK